MYHCDKSFLQSMTLVSAVAMALATSAPVQAADWYQIAAEGQSIVFPDGNPRNIRFGGVNGIYRTTYNQNHDITCTAEWFGRKPKRGQPRICEAYGQAPAGTPQVQPPPPQPEVVQQPTPAPEPDLAQPVPTPQAAPARATGYWTKIANEGQVITFPDDAPRNLRFGGVHGVYRSSYQGAQNITCSTAWFGQNPAAGLPRICEVFGATHPVSSFEDVIKPAYRFDGGSSLPLRRVAEWWHVVNGDQSAFRTRCEPSHLSYEDPIVFAKVPPGNNAHLHLFFGNTAADRYLDASNILSRGNSTCAGGTLNRTAYWVPAMMSRGNQPLTPANIFAYYKSGGSGIPRAKIVNTLPAGLRMISGVATSQTMQDPNHYGFACIGPNGENDGHWVLPMPASCPQGFVLRQKVEFPQCWDGNLDSANHRSHMSFTVNAPSAESRRDCPATHPFVIPEITIVVDYAVTSIEQFKTWRLSSDHANFERGQSNHADWFNGWDQAVATTWLHNCVKRPKNNSNDCVVDLLGDGTELYSEY